MKKKIAALLATLMVVAGISTITASPASAYSSTWTERHCHTYARAGLPGDSITSCLTVGWRTQDDGTGIRVEDIKFDGDCDQLENNGYQGYAEGFVKASYPSDPGGPGAVWRNPYYYFNCGQWYDAELRLDDTTNRYHIYASAFLRVDGSWDFTDEWGGFDICKGNTC
jgi:hypothetical protein